jgi:hypothetical protein
MNTHHSVQLKQTMDELIAKHEKQREQWEKKEKKLLQEKDLVSAPPRTHYLACRFEVEKERNRLFVQVAELSNKQPTIEDKRVKLPKVIIERVNSIKVRLAKLEKCRHYQKSRFMTHTSSSVKKVSAKVTIGAHANNVTSPTGTDEVPRKDYSAGTAHELTPKNLTRHKMSTPKTHLSLASLAVNGAQSRIQRRSNSRQTLDSPK